MLVRRGRGGGAVAQIALKFTKCPRYLKLKWLKWPKNYCLYGLNLHYFTLKFKIFSSKLRTSCGRELPHVLPSTALVTRLNFNPKVPCFVDITAWQSDY